MNTLVLICACLYSAFAIVVLACVCCAAWLKDEDDEDQND